MKNIFTILFLFVIATWNAVAQNNVYNKTALQQITGQPAEVYYLPYESLPFYQNDRLDGSLTLISGDVYKNLKLMYDMHKGQVLYYNPELKITITVDNEIIREFSVVNKQGETENFKKIRTRFNNIINENYYSVLHEDSISLLIQYQSIIEKFQYADLSTNKIGKFVNKKQYYYYDGNKMVELLISKSKLYELFPSIKPNLKKFVRQHHLKPKKQNDLKVIFMEINRLLQITT